MKIFATTLTSLAIMPSAAAFMTLSSARATSKPLDSSTTIDADSAAQEKRALYDPLGLYPKNSDERKEGRLENLEDRLFNSANNPYLAQAPANSKEEDLELTRQVIAMREDMKVDTESGRTIYDPFRLYPEDSVERKEGLIKGLEPKVVVRNAVVDPLGLYPKDTPNMESSSADMNTEDTRNIYDPLQLYPENSSERVEGRIRNLEADLFKGNDEVTFEEDGVVLSESSRDIYDPLRLYPEDSVERKEGKIKALEPTVVTEKDVFDPLGLYPEDTSTNDVVEKSTALPFTSRPSVLTGELPGDAGFDPFGLATSKEELIAYRGAEIKHSRLAMLAAIGWPLSELWDKQFAAAFHMIPLLGDGDRVPSILNGGLEKVNPFYWGAILALASCIEVLGMLRGPRETPGDLGFDPLNLYPEDKEGQERMQLAEIKHGRIAMIAVTLYALEEALTKTGIINQTPFFFHPIHL